uniref:Uncharacterized protein n=1 Tax=Anopheles dirus TaxID=7168 RepID=A0A182NXF0_9DIPT
ASTEKNVESLQTTTTQTPGVRQLQLSPSGSVKLQFTRIPPRRNYAGKLPRSKRPCDPCDRPTLQIGSLMAMSIQQTGSA